MLLNRLKLIRLPDIRLLSFTIGVFLLHSFSLTIRCYAQNQNYNDMENGYFGTYNSSGLLNPASGTCLSFCPATLPNWIVTNGTPSVNNSPRYIFMFGNVGSGEGIAGYYNFWKGVEYNIEIKGSLNYHAATNGNIALRIFVANGIPDVSPNIPNSGYGCGTLVPIVIDKQEIATINGPQNFTFPATITFPSVPPPTFTPNADYTQIWIYPMSDQANVTADATIEYVKISACTGGFAWYYYPYNQSPTFFPPNIYLNQNVVPAGTTAKRHITAGTNQNYINGFAYGNGPTAPVEVNPDAVTKFVGEEIMLYDNFLAKPNTEGLFMAVGMRTCDGGDPIGSKGGTTSKDIGSLPKLVQPENKQNSILIYPSPNNGLFTIETVETGNYDIKVLNNIGSVVYSDKLNNERKRVVQLDVGLPSGSYIVQLTGKDVRYIEKITVVR